MKLSKNWGTILQCIWIRSNLNAWTVANLILPVSFVWDRSVSRYMAIVIIYMKCIAIIDEKDWKPETEQPEQLKQSELPTTRIFGSKTLENHFESFCEWLGSSKKPKEDDQKDINDSGEKFDTSLKTFRIIYKDTPTEGNITNTIQQDSSVIVHDISPAKFRFTSENDDEGNKLIWFTYNKYSNIDYTIEEANAKIKFNPNDFYHQSEYEKSQSLTSRTKTKSQINHSFEEHKATQ